MQVELDELLPEVTIWAPKVPDIVAFRFIREVTREMCQKAPLWRHTDDIDVTTPESEPLFNLTDAEVVKIGKALFGETELVPVTIAWLDAEFDDWRSLEDETPRYITQDTPNTMTLVPKATGTVTLTVQLKPSRNAQTLPDFLVSQYATQIGSGAAAKVLMIPEQDYTNPQLGLAMQAEFKAFLDGLPIEASKGQQNARLRTTPRFL